MVERFLKRFDRISDRIVVLGASSAQSSIHRNYVATWLRVGGNMQPTYSDMEARLTRLEQYFEAIKICLVVVGLLGGSLFAVVKYSNAGSFDSRILHLRGLVIEDESGRPRVLLGAPVSNQGRKRTDTLTGIVFLSENGIDRLTMGSIPNAQVTGAINKRVANGVGLLLNDPRGNERGGFGFLDNGRVSLGLDRADGNEGAILTVSDEDKWAGLRIKDNHSWIVMSLGHSAEDGSRLLFRDGDGKDRVVFGLKDSARPKLEINDRDEKLLFDALAK
jgi:hypothetical protein